MDKNTFVGGLTFNFKPDKNQPVAELPLSQLAMVSEDQRRPHMMS